ncbi:hypothetical protein Tco_0936161 [Tanacetum coccineum]
MSSATSDVTYTSVYTDSEPVAPPSPDFILGPENPQTPPVPQEEDEREPLFIQAHDPNYVPEPIYPEYIPLEDDHEFPAEEQPLPPIDSPTTESPGYVTESDPEEDPEGIMSDLSFLRPSTEARSERTSVHDYSHLHQPPISLSPPSAGRRDLLGARESIMNSQRSIYLWGNRDDSLGDSNGWWRRRAYASPVRLGHTDTATAAEYFFQTQAPDTVREMSDMQAELLALREPQRRVRQPGPEARISDHQEAFRDADSFFNISGSAVENQLSLPPAPVRCCLDCVDMSQIRTLSIQRHRP